jgi:hypothetical protein
LGTLLWRNGGVRTRVTAATIIHTTKNTNHPTATIACYYANTVKCAVHTFSNLKSPLLQKVPNSSLGWFRAGVGFHNKAKHNFAIECFEKAVEIDPKNVLL